MPDARVDLEPNGTRELEIFVVLVPDWPEKPRELLETLHRERVDALLGPVEAVRVAGAQVGEHAQHCDAEHGRQQRAGSVLADPPGLTTHRIEVFPRKRAPGPLWPLDPNATYDTA